MCVWISNFPVYTYTHLHTHKPFLSSLSPPPFHLIILRDGNALLVICNAPHLTSGCDLTPCVERASVAHKQKNKTQRIELYCLFRLYERRLK